MDAVRRSRARQQQFIKSKRWQVDGKGGVHIRQKAMCIMVAPVSRGYRIIVDGIRGNRNFLSVDDAKAYIFKLLENDALDAFLRKRKRRQEYVAVVSSAS